MKPDTETPSSVAARKPLPPGTTRVPEQRHSERFCCALMLGALVLAGLGGCVGGAPPQQGSFSSSPPPDSVPGAAILPGTDQLGPAEEVLLADWYVSRFEHSGAPADLFALRQRRRVAGEALVQGWREGLLRAYGPALQARGSLQFRLSPEGLAALEKPDVIRSQMLALRDALGQGIALGTADTLRDAFAKNPGLRPYRRDLESWLEQQPGHLPFPNAANVPALREDVRLAIAAAEQKARLLQALRQSESLQQQGLVPAAMAAIETALDAAGEGELLTLIGDAESVPTLRERLARIPRAAVIGRCRAIDAGELRIVRECIDGLENGARNYRDCAAATAAAEGRLSESLAEWQADARFQAALNEQGPAIVELARLIARARGRVWSRRIEELVAERAWVEAGEFAADCLRMVGASADDGLLCYRYADAHPLPDDPLPVTCLGIIRSELGLPLAPALPAAFEELLELSDREADIALRQGSGFALCTILMRLRELAGDHADARVLAPLLERARARIERSEVFLRRTVFSRNITVEEFSSSTAGLGATFAKDIDLHLRRARDTCGCGGHISVVTPDTALEPGDCRLAEGRIAAFDAEETSEQSTIRHATRWGPVSPRAAADGTTDGYVQEQLGYAIHAKTVERVAHIRLDLELVCGKTHTPISVNDFLRKAFVQESFHPFADVRVLRTLSAPRREDLHAEEPEPELRNDRVWTAGEMLDWARRQAQHIVVLDTLAAILRYPLEVRATAVAMSEARRWAEAADAWGTCQAYLGSVGLPAAAWQEAFAMPDTAGERLLEALAGIARQDAATRALGPAVEGGMWGAVAALVRESRKQRLNSAAER
ncbi:MAG: hypothetical protein JXR77_09800 [Lentisphaeria bacterium]|nr:hypothetical protein [Lentisphaeria bacterium]